ncbi:hypothetical protein F5J12DRAFT_798772 [Pisolithus orientalis]|uniref:uncharacterized protein n=1 Tax=Pisolithus orientalis TaxID=936130 RepID=UPI002224AF2E|nr:uncharacterized protein F5J12DRAFT_798772 [Pisolithus orientalis]KAI6033114.1 hypothetical protein F5J12DRAFT_798772 [Pisolithus orientalis]
MSLSSRLKERIFHSDSLFCCIPIRVGFVLMTLSTFLVAGVISAIVWFEISHSYQLTTNEWVAFILTGVVETILCLLSIAGFVGVVARKQSLVMMYTYVLYAHAILNVIVDVYFLVTIRKGNRQQLVDYCVSVLAGTSMESSCTQLKGISTYVLIAIVAILLLLELYGTVVATRYAYDLQVQERGDRPRHLSYFHTPSSKHSRQTSDDVELLQRDGAHASYSAVPRVDLNDPEEHAFDTGLHSPTAYSLVPVYERGLSVFPPGYSPQPSQETLSSDRSRRIRALSLRPSSDSSAGISPSGLEVLGNREPLSPDEEECPTSPCTEELSTAAHVALMDHAAYIRPTFSPP